MVQESFPGWVQDPEDPLVHVNVGGLKRSLCSSTLRKFPDTRLGRLLACESEEAILQVCDDYDVQQREFYFDRNPGLFPYVLHFYQTGKLHIMEELCVFSFSQVGMERRDKEGGIGKGWKQVDFVTSRHLFSLGDRVLGHQ